MVAYNCRSWLDGWLCNLASQVNGVGVAKSAIVMFGRRALPRSQGKPEEACD